MQEIATDERLLGLCHKLAGSFAYDAGAIALKDAAH